jgi:hypothetical protein
MTDIKVVQAYQEAVRILSIYDILVDGDRELFHAYKYKNERPLIFQNFNTAAELLAYARGFAQREETGGE